MSMSPTSRAAVDNLGELALKLQERLDTVPEGARAVYLRADEALPYSAILNVLRVCRETGVHEVALLSQRKIEG
jgi:biopolymer transport protein ExbD